MFTRKAAMILTIALISSLSANAQKGKPAGQEKARVDLMKALRGQLINRLKDPESARFKDEFLSLPEDPTTGVRSLCGQVNAKNSYGGYVGFKLFIVNSEGMVVMDTAEVPSATEFLWPVWCGKPI